MFKRNKQIMQDYFSIVDFKDKNLIIYILFNLLTNLINLIIPIITALIIENITKENYQKVFIDITMLAIGYLSYNTFKFFDYWFYASFFKNTYVRIHSKLINSIYHFKQNYSIPNGVIINTSNMDIINISELPSFLFQTIIQIIKLIIIFIVFLNYNIYIGIYVIIINYLYFYIANYCNKKKAYFHKKQLEDADKLTHLLAQVLNGLQDIKTLSIFNKLDNKFNIYRKKWQNSYFSKRKYYFSRKSFVVYIMELGKILMYILSTILIMQGKIDLTLLIIFISYYEKTQTTIDNIIDYDDSIIEESVSLYRIIKILDFSNEDNILYGNINSDNLTGQIEFKNVSFNYKKLPTIKNISFLIKPNTITAIVGKTGAGKTTIFNLLLRINQVDSGKIFLDNINIYDYSENTYSNNIAIVNQKTFIFNMSIKENLSLIDNNKEHQIEACKKVGVHDFIMSLPDGYNTILKEDAKNISGGQKQLISLARALLTKSKVILLDEITSALDPKTTKNIINLLKDLKSEHTLVIITHNKDIMKHSEKLIVLNKGKIVGIGSHKYLIKNNAFYQDLLNNN